MVCFWPMGSAIAWDVTNPSHRRMVFFVVLRILVAITGASGALYAQRLLDNLDPAAHEVHVVLSAYALAVLSEELPDGLRLPPVVKACPLKSMNTPFASRSNPPDAVLD